MSYVRGAAARIVGIAGAFLPVRHWHRLDARFPVSEMALVSALLTFFAGAAIGIPGFFAHASGQASRANDLMLATAATQVTNVPAGQPEVTTAFAQGLTALSFFTFLLLTPAGWATMYLCGSGCLRAVTVTFDDPIGDPILTGIDAWLHRTTGVSRERRARAAREALEGPEMADRVVTGAAARLPADIVVVSARAKAGWTPGTVVIGADRCYRIGTPVERTIAGRLRTLYPLTEHRDHEAIRRSVHYDFGGAAKDNY
ncbi:MAG: hypothetical protein DMF85_13830 [Acidobacteria bacterium]|nr:MAG: hypothetical protein DMF85_13830 [Acidobacteriota bacterium]